MSQDNTLDDMPTAGAEAVGTFLDGSTMRFDVAYPHPPGRVWRALTDPEELAAWFIPMDLEPRLGGRVAMRQNDTMTARPAGVVTVFDVEKVLEYRFERGDAHFGPGCVLRFELIAEREGTRLVFIHRLAPGATYPGEAAAAQIAGPGTFAPGTGAGWHGFLQEGLSRHLGGRPAPVYDDHDDAVMAEREVGYRQLAHTLAPTSPSGHTSPAARFLSRHAMVHQRWYPHPIERVWDAVTTDEHLGVWLLPVCRVEPRAGGRCSFSWGGPAEEAIAGVVSAFEPPRYVRFTFGHPDAYLEFVLEATAGGTRLCFTQSFPPGTTPTSSDHPGMDAPAGDDNPWQAGFVAGFHAMLDRLPDYLDGTFTAGDSERELEATRRGDHDEAEIALIDFYSEMIATACPQ